MSVHDDRVTFRIPLSCTSLSFGFVKMLKNPTKLDTVGVFIYPDELLVFGDKSLRYPSAYSGV